MPSPSPKLSSASSSASASTSTSPQRPQPDPAQALPCADLEQAPPQPHHDDHERVPGSRHYLRSTVLAVGDRAQQMLRHTKSSSSVAKFTLDQVERLVEPYTAGKWQEYGEPLLSSLDDRINSVVSAIRTVTAGGSDGDDEAESDSDAEEMAGTIMSVEQPSVYWERLKSTFIASHWFQRVDSILAQNVGAVKCVIRPAEFFYTSAAECYLAHENFEEFLEALKRRLGAQWDDRLTQPSKVFFATARTAAAIVGAGRFFSGALRLGRAKISTAIDQLMVRWEQVLGATEEVVDKWLPEKMKAQSPAEAAAAEALSKLMSRQQNHSSTGTDFDSDEMASLSQLDDMEVTAPLYTTTTTTTASTTASGSSSGGMPADVSEPCLCSNGSAKRRRMTELARKVSRRVRQRIPMVNDGLKETLGDGAWFQNVEDILSENVIVRSMGSVARPAEHFYDTASTIFLENKFSVEQFLAALQRRLGHAWDERLVGPARDFYASASQVWAASLRSGAPGSSSSGAEKAPTGVHSCHKRATAPRLAAS